LGGLLESGPPTFPFLPMRLPNITPEPMADEDIGETCRRRSRRAGSEELLEVLHWSDADRAALIGRLHLRREARWLAEILIDLEDDVGEIARLRLVSDLRARLGP
jgi:hypothetical protein